MVLIECAECDGKVSNKASACPHCGCPAIDYKKTELAPKVVPPNNKDEKEDASGSSGSAPINSNIWAKYDRPSQKTKNSILKGFAPGQLRGKSVFFCAIPQKMRLLDMPLVHNSNFAEALSLKEKGISISKVLGGKYSPQILSAILEGEIPASFQYNNYGKGYMTKKHEAKTTTPSFIKPALYGNWKIYKSHLMLSYEHPLYGSKILPPPDRLNWTAFWGGGVWALITQTWVALWISFVSSVTYSRIVFPGSEREELMPLILILLFLKGIFLFKGNRIRHNSLVKNGYKIKKIYIASNIGTAEAYEVNSTYVRL